MKKSKPSVLRMFISFLKLGLVAFGGPTMIAYVRDMVVDQKKWMDEKNFKNGVALSQVIPGASVMQVVAYVGLSVNGIIGAITAFTAFAFPAFLTMLFLTIAYVHLKSIPETATAFKALRIVVVALAANGTISFGRKNIKNLEDIFLLTFAAILFILKLSPFTVVLIAAAIGLLIHSRSKHAKPLVKEKVKSKVNRLKVFRYALFTLAFVLLLSLMLRVIDPDLSSISTLMIKVDALAFGGGYGSVPFMLHEVVDIKGLMNDKTFMDGIALGQITPGPIVITATFVGYIVKGIVGSIVATVSVFTPSFIILLFSVPLFDTVKNNPTFKGIFQSILVSFVGLMTAVTLRFASSVQWNLASVIIVTAAFIALRKKCNILWVVILSVIAGMLAL